jgi:hypothetical protein
VYKYICCGAIFYAVYQASICFAQQGPDRNIYIVVEKRTFYTMQDELQKKIQEVEELSTRYRGCPCEYSQEVEKVIDVEIHTALLDYLNRFPAHLVNSFSGLTDQSCRSLVGVLSISIL